MSFVCSIYGQTYDLFYILKTPSRNQGLTTIRIETNGNVDPGFPVLKPHISLDVLDSIERMDSELTDNQTMLYKKPKVALVDNV